MVRVLSEKFRKVRNVSKRINSLHEPLPEREAVPRITDFPRFLETFKEAENVSKIFNFLHQPLLVISRETVEF